MIPVMTRGPVLLPLYRLTSVSTFIVRNSSQSRSVSDVYARNLNFPLFVSFLAYGQDNMLCLMSQSLCATVGVCVCVF